MYRPRHVCVLPVRVVIADEQSFEIAAREAQQKEQTKLEEMFGKKKSAQFEPPKVAYTEPTLQEFIEQENLREQQTEWLQQNEMVVEGT